MMYVLWALSACSNTPVAEAPAAPEPVKEDPAEAPAPVEVATPEPLPGDDVPGDAEAGSAVYETYCKACHQADGSGMNSTLAADFSEAGRLDKSDEQLLHSIRKGFTGKVGTMPPWGETLSGQETRDALAYVRATFGKKE